MAQPNNNAEAKGPALDPDLPSADTLLSPAELVPKKDYFLKRIDDLTIPLQLKPEDGEFNVKGWIRGASGGLTCADMEQLESQKGVFAHLIKSFGANLMSGKSVVNVSLPVRVFEPRSFLQRIPDAWCYAPLFLTKAAFAPSPLERLKYCIAFMVSGLHKAVTNTKPFNPILGETFQGSFSDGSHVYLEQTSHHPPISSFQMIGPNGIYHLHGSQEFTASLRANSIVGAQVGPTFIDFLDGSRIVYHVPQALVRGTVLGDRNFTWIGTCKFTDEKNGLSCDLVFNPDDKGTWSRMFSAQKTPDDHIRGEIIYEGPLPLEQVEPLLKKPQTNAGAAAPAPEQGHKLQGHHKKRGSSRQSLNKAAQIHQQAIEKHVVSVCEGSWMDGMNFGAPGHPLVSYWAKGTVTPFKIALHEEPLPSDSRFREDLAILIKGDLDEAQKWKSALEEKQRAEKHLRKEAEKKVKTRLDALQKKPFPSS